jgi:hypothetical protein
MRASGRDGKGDSSKMSSTSEKVETDVLRERLLKQQPQSSVLLDRLLARLDGKRQVGAFAPIRDRRCSGCQMTVAAVRLQRAKSGEFLSCACCSRFLYIESTGTAKIPG